jgi:hypothetical protein
MAHSTPLSKIERIFEGLSLESPPTRYAKCGCNMISLGATFFTRAAKENLGRSLACLPEVLLKRACSFKGPDKGPDRETHSPRRQLAFSSPLG